MRKAPVKNILFSLVIAAVGLQFTGCGKLGDLPKRPQYTMAEFTKDLGDLAQSEDQLKQNEACEYASTNTSNEPITLACSGYAKLSTVTALQAIAGKIDGHLAKYDNAIIVEGTRKMEM